eukprot:Clim_evm71s172 gene=Clim_evmTU71s172
MLAKATHKQSLRCEACEEDGTVMTRSATRQYMAKVEEVPERPATPTLDDEAEEAQAVHDAATYLQATLRGRAAQQPMFEGMERRRELIDEMRSTRAVRPLDYDQERELKTTAQIRQQERKTKVQRIKMLSSKVDAPCGHLIASTLDYLSKELVHLREEHRIAAMLKIAERDRRQREAAEAGRRKAEEARRQQDDQAFMEMVLSNRLTVDSYLEAVLMESVNSIADYQARGFARGEANRLNELVKEVETSGRLSAETQVAALVNNFLFPEVEKQIIRENIIKTQRQYIATAHALLVRTLPDCPTAPGTTAENDQTPGVSEADELGPDHSTENEDNKADQ